ncbi:hypothetical protein SynBIOSU31_03203 [Synechococcus sp. BIOS-U3-1]|nr:hypothetical protein SynBIOSU31_03203 [Synechococcus sp. BIOS-U3-1]
MDWRGRRSKGAQLVNGTRLMAPNISSGGNIERLQSLAINPFA